MDPLQNTRPFAESATENLGSQLIRVSQNRKTIFCGSRNHPLAYKPSHADWKPSSKYMGRVHVSPTLYNPNLAKEVHQTYNLLASKIHGGTKINEE